MPKVLRIINRLTPGGPTFNALLLARHLPQEFETLLVVGGKKSQPELPSNLKTGYRLISVLRDGFNPLFDLLAYRKIRKAIRKFRPDIVHTHSEKAGLLGRLAAIHEKVPVIIHSYHEHSFQRSGNPFSKTIRVFRQRFLAKRSKALIAFHSAIKKDLVLKYRICEPEKIRIIPIGYDLSRFQEGMSEKRKLFREKYLLDDDELAVGISGRLTPVKNHSLFLVGISRALNQLNKKARFFIIGEGDQFTPLMKEARALGIDTVFFPEEKRKATLSFCEWTRDADVIVAGLDIVALTSFQESTPVSLIEAQAGNRAIISTYMRGIENFVVQDETALLTDNNNPEQFTNGLVRLINDDELREKFGRNGWKNVREKFHYTRLINDTSALYHNLLTRRYGR